MRGRLGNSLGVDRNEAVSIVEELHLAQRDQVSTLRATSVRKVGAKAVIRPADAVLRDQRCEGRTLELRPDSLTASLDRPLMVGSWFVVEPDRATLDLPPQLVRCEQCCMRSELDFEVRLVFQQPVLVPDTDHGP